MKETKNVPQLRFSAFDDEWEEKKLGDTICEVNERTSDFNKNPLFSLTIENGITEKTERYERSQLVTKDDDLFKIMHPQNFATNPMNLRFGAVGYSKEKQDISVSGYYDVFSIDNNECSDFWYSYFKTDKILKKFDDAATGSLIEKRRVHFSVLKQLVFLQPNHKEKQKIGTFLSHVDSLIQAKTKKLESLKAVKKSLLQKCFPKAGEKVPEIRFAGFSGDWEEKKLGEIAVIRRGLTYSPSDISDNGIRVLRSSNIDEDHFVINQDDVYVKEKAVNIDFIKNDDILITAANGSLRLVGKHGLVKGIKENSAVHGGFMVILSSTISIFLNYSMDSEWYKSFLSLNVAGGNGSIGNLNTSLLEEQVILLPKEKSEQQKIGQFFSKYDSLISTQQKEIDKLKDIKKSLLQKMFV